MSRKPEPKRNTLHREKKRVTKKYSAKERDVLIGVLQVMELFRAKRHTMPVTQVCAYLRVAINPGKSVIEYTRDAAVSQSVMSRQLLDIGSATRNYESGLRLLDSRPRATNLRTHEVHLTEEGFALGLKIARRFLAHHDT